MSTGIVAWKHERNLEAGDVEEERRMSAPDLGQNLVASFHHSVARGGTAPFLWAKRGEAWVPWSWQQVGEQVAAVAGALRARGLQPGDRVLLVSENRPEWLIADLAVMSAGGISVPAYTTNTPDNHRYLLENAEIAAVVVSGDRLATRLFAAIEQASHVRLALAIEPLATPPPEGVDLLHWDEALALGAVAGADGPDPATTLATDDIACLIYTSGTGGQPKGVMLTHGNIIANVRGAYEVLELVGLGDDVFLSFLPLSHAYEHTAGQFLPIASMAQIYYAEGIDALRRNLIEVRPTIMACVPRFYEVMRQRVLTQVERTGGLRAKLFHKALQIGLQRYHDPGSIGWTGRALDRLLDRLVRDKVRARFGGRMKAMVSGGAPLNPDVGLFFHALGLPIFQGYGQTENGPVACVNLPGKVKMHSVGPPIPGLEAQIAADGEILLRGQSVMKGYWRDETATAKALQNGWLHTGDVGRMDEDGFIQITDRKRDLIVNSGGDNVAPQRVEGILMLEPEINQVIVFGDRRPHLVALIVPDADFVTQFARARKQAPDLVALARDPDFRRAIGHAVGRANNQLSVIERVRGFDVMPGPFTIDDGSMTPTLKLRRQIIYQRHAELFEDLYRPRGAERAATS